MIDAVVIGAGLAGSAAAWELSRRGRSVVVLERFEPGHDRGSSHGRERIMRLGYTTPLYVQLGLEALDGWARLEEEAGRRLLHVSGAIDHGADDELAEIEAAYRACLVRYEWLSAGAARERWPGLRFEGRVLHQPGGGWLEADAVLAAFRAGSVARGADWRYGVEVLRIEASGGGVQLRTAEAELSAAVAIVTAGAWCDRLLWELIELPALCVTEEQVAYLSPRTADEPWPCFIHRGEPLHYGLPTPDGRLKVGEHGTGPVVDPDHRRSEVEPVSWARLLTSIPHWVPGVDPEPVEAATCLYATTPTDDFVIDRVGPLVVGAGFGGHGFKFAPVIGRLLADLALGGPTGGPFALATAPSRQGRSRSR